MYADEGQFSQIAAWLVQLPGEQLLQRCSEKRVQ
jgi:hypothetical protein